MIGAPGNAEVADRTRVVGQRVLASVAIGRAPFRYRQLRVLRQVALAVGGVLVLGAGAGIVTTASMEQVHYWAICYTKASVTSRANNVAQTSSEKTGRSRPNPIDICLNLWRQGVQDNAHSKYAIQTYPRSNLVWCTSKDDIPAIFPRDGSTASVTQFCAALGMRPPERTHPG